MVGGVWAECWCWCCCWWALIAWRKHTKSFDLILESGNTGPTTPSDANYHCPNDNENVDKVDCNPALHEERRPHYRILEQEKKTQQHCQETRLLNQC